MDIAEYEKIIRAMPATGVFIIREDNHEILYFNKRVQEVAPHVCKGIPCRKLGNPSCAGCPLLDIGDREENRAIGYNNLFGEIVDIVAVRIRWEQEIPAFAIMVAPHMQGINHTYHRILRVNLSRDRYETIKMRPEDRAIGYDGDTFSGWLGQMIYNGGIHPDDLNNFISFTRPERLKSALGAGQDILTCCYRRRVGEDYRWNLMEIVPDLELSARGDQLIFLYVKDIHDILQEGLELDDASIRIQEVIRTLGEQNFGIYSIDLDTGEANLVRENGHTHTGWRSLSAEWNEVMKSHLLGQIHPADRNKVYEKFSLDGLRKTKESSAGKTDMLCRWRGDEDHEYRYMAVIAYFGQSHGSKDYTILALQNVDKRVRQENTLTLRDMQLAAILKSRYSVMNTVYLENGQCERTWINEGSGMEKAITGSYHQYFQNELETAVHPEDAEAFCRVMSPEHLYQTATATREYYEEVCQYRLAGSTLSWMEEHVIYSRQGSRMSVNILGRDITAEKLEEENRRRGEQEQADIISSLGGMFFATYYADLKEATFRSVTQLKEVEKVLDGKVDYATGLKTYADNFIHPDDREEYLHLLSIENLRRTLNKKNPYVTLAYRKIPEHPDTRPGEYGWIRGTAVMSQADADGRPLSVVYAAQDVTESKRKEMREQQAIQAACEAADHANASKQEFLSCMSHNVRTPMNGIMGMIKIAADHVEDTERVTDCLEKASASSRQLLSVLNEIMDVSQIQSGSFDLKAEPFALSALMDEVVSEIRPDIEDKKLHLNIHPMQVDHGDVLGDFLRLRQVFLNILGNSVKFTPEGGTLDIFVTEHETGERSCSSYDFVFRDNGIGMEETFIRHIFEPFSRAEDPRKSNTGGVGLGMTIAQNIVRMMGGNISVESTPGRGTEFVVTLILRLQNLAEGAGCLPDEAGEPDPASSFRGTRILLVEDNELNQEIAMELIGELGARVECAADGRRGLQRFAEMPEGYYDMILMDVQMPVMNGYEATRAIRKLPRADAAAIPIIALSANATPEDIAAGRDAGMNAHLPKPLDVSQLMERMDYWLSKR